MLELFIKKQVGKFKFLQKALSINDKAFLLLAIVIC